MPKPTPTQEENDLAAMGVIVMVKEHDGSEYEDPDTPPPPEVEQDLPPQQEPPPPEVEQRISQRSKKRE
jgi:hypothetical protein